MKKIKPLSDHILVQRVEAKDVVKGGIVIPDSAKEKPQEAIVKAVGPGKLEEGKRIAIDLKPGQRVLITKYGGTEVKFDDQEYLLVREDDVIAVLED
jgi:chaperonin GroES